MKKILPLYFLLFFFLFVQAESFAQKLRFVKITSEHGLSQATVNCIYEDSKGYLWFGTQDGLNRYNGYEMTIFKHNPSDSNSLSHNYIECIYEDRKGILWIGTRYGGLNAFNPLLNKFTRFQHNPEDENSISGNSVKCIVEDKSGTFWVGTNFGLNSFDGKQNKFTHYLHETDDTLSLNGYKVEALYEDKKGRLWVGTFDGGLNWFDRSNKTFRCFLYQSQQKGKEYFNSIESITEDETGLLWLATDNGGFTAFDPVSRRFLQRFLHDAANPENSLSDNRVTALCFDNKGGLWLGTRNGGLSRYNKNNGTFSIYRHHEYDPQSLSNDEITCIFRDRQGNMWLGTGAGGVNVYFVNNDRFKHYHPDVSNQHAFLSGTVFALCQDSDGIIWAGTQHGGITAIDRAKKNYTYFGDGKEGTLSSARNNSVLSLFEDKDGLIWAGTQGSGVNTYNKITGKINSILKAGAVISMAQGHQNIIWLGIYGNTGLFAYDKNSQSLTKYTTEDGLSSNSIYCVYEDENRRVWIGTADGGLNMLDYNTGRVKYFLHDKQKNSISNNTVYSIYKDTKGNLWVGTAIGLNKLNIQTETFTHYFEKDGLPNASIFGILGDRHGNLWMSTNKGITRFNPNIENRDGSAFKNFSMRDGLQGDEFAQGSYFHNQRTGEMFFGGLNGFNSFFPDNIVENKNIPPVYITSFKKFGKDVETDTSISDKKFIELSYKDNFISLEFVALDYSFPSKNKYSFMMEGLDKDWSPPSTRRYVSYTNLPGGNYIFRVKGANSDGVWNEQGAKIYITVIPPWWKTNAFYAFCVLFSLASVFAFIRYRTASIQKEKKILEQKVAERTAELAQKNKDITSSIQYALRIQEAILPSREFTLKHFPNSFILYEPKDIVSGDFYWCGEKNGRKIFACVDCTGHGVPGAFMSMIGTNLLNQIILENGVTEPAAILAALNQGVRSALKQGTDPEHTADTTDGMDIALISVVPETREVQFAGALRPLVLVSKGTLEKIDGNKFPIGGAQLDIDRIFSNHLRFLEKGEMLYMFSDGYADQFGGDKGKKFMLKRMHELLLAASVLPIKEQYDLLNRKLREWKAGYSQVDDILVIGVRM